MRYTYCVVQRPEAQLQCFYETDSPQVSSKSMVSVFSLSDTQSPAIFLETIPSRQNSGASTPYDIVIVHQNGFMRWIAGDLSAQRWSTKMPDESIMPASDLTVKAAHWISGSQARRSLLKNRPDLEVDGDGKDLGLLALITKRMTSSDQGAQDIMYGLWSLTEMRSLSALSQRSGKSMTPLVTKALPDTKTWRDIESAQYNFNPVNGALSVSFRNELITYNLSNYTPEVSSKLSTESNSYPMRLTPSLAVGSTSSTVTLYDSKYNSIQSIVDLQQTGLRRKRKRSGGANRSSIQFIAYFAQIQKLIALRGRALIAFEITRSATQGSRNALSGESMLIDAIGRGKPSGKPPNMETPESSYLDFGTSTKASSGGNEKWASLRNALENLFEKDDVIAFEELLAEELCSSSEPSERTSYAGLQLPSPSHHVDQVKVDYLISKVFEPVSDVDVGWDETTEPGNNLKIALRTPRLIHWLILARQLIDKKVEEALNRTRSSHAFTVRPGAVGLALMREQPSSEMITDYLRQSAVLPLRETLQMAKVLLKHVIANATTSLPPTLSQDRGKDHEVFLAEDAVPTEQEDDVGSAQPLALGLKLPPEDTKAPSQSWKALLIALKRLGSHSSRNVTAALHSQLSQSEILSTIQVLRQQLFHSGHTTYLPTPWTLAHSSTKPSDTHTDRDLMTLDTILRLLGNCLDAIGPVGFLAQSESDDFLERLIPELRSEVSFAFEGMQETNHLQGLLREVIRYADSTQIGKDGFAANHPFPEHVHLDAQQKSGTIVTLYTEPTQDQGDVEGRGGLLPLSLRANNIVSQTKVRKGGGQVSRRSRRDILKLQDRNVARYSFERLMM